MIDIFTETSNASFPPAPWMRISLENKSKRKLFFFLSNLSNFKFTPCNLRINPLHLCYPMKLYVIILCPKSRCPSKGDSFLPLLKLCSSALILKRFNNTKESDSPTQESILVRKGQGYSGYSPLWPVRSPICRIPMWSRQELAQMIIGI